MMAIIAILYSLLFGWLIVRWMTQHQLPLSWQLILGQVIGIISLSFYAFLMMGLLKIFNPFIILGVLILLMFILGYYQLGFNRLRLPPLKQWPWYWLLSLIPLVLALLLLALAYPYGGWDAWSCWNLKAKFIYLGKENFDVMFQKELWRSNTHYPLLLPFYTALHWFFSASPHQLTPLLNSVVFTFTIMALLYLTLKHLGVNTWLNVLLGFVIFSNPFVQLLAISQYSDILIALFILSFWSCFLLRRQFPSLVLCIPLILGALSFTKTEGMVASLLLAFLAIYQEPRLRQFPIFGLWALGFMPTIIFQLTMAPGNEAFTNGLTSTTNPLTWQRLQIIAIYPWIELISVKWSGLWIILIILLMLNAKRLIRTPESLMGIFILSYGGAIAAYYSLNTFFEIIWWLNTTLHRLIFAILPTMALLIGLSSRQQPLKDV